MLRPHSIVYKITTIILSARLFASCPASTPAFLFPTCNVLIHLIVGLASDVDSAAGALSVEAARYASTRESQPVQGARRLQHIKVLG